MGALTPFSIFVEGKDDLAVLKRWVPNLPFECAGGKDNVRSKIKPGSTHWGLLDRDFASNEQVRVSRQPGSHVILLQRYCIENYLLEPAIIAVVAQTFINQHPPLAQWTEAGMIGETLMRWGSELAIYTAANAIIDQWSSAIGGDFLSYWKLLPPQSRVAVLTELQNRLRRLQRLPSIESIEKGLETLYTQVRSEIVNWDGLHRWINGKVLLEGYLYPQVFQSIGLSQQRLRDALIEAGTQQVPDELAQLAELWREP